MGLCGSSFATARGVLPASRAVARKWAWLLFLRAVGGGARGSYFCKPQLGDRVTAISRCRSLGSAEQLLPPAAAWIGGRILESAQQLYSQAAPWRARSNFLKKLQFGERTAAVFISRSLESARQLFL